jgi:hypothetical protein
LNAPPVVVGVAAGAVEGAAAPKLNAPPVAEGAAAGEPKANAPPAPAVEIVGAADVAAEGAPKANTPEAGAVVEVVAAAEPKAGAAAVVVPNGEGAAVPKEPTAGVVVGAVGVPKSPPAGGTAVGAAPNPLAVLLVEPPNAGAAAVPVVPNDVDGAVGCVVNLVPAPAEPNAGVSAAGPAPNSGAVASVLVAAAPLWLEAAAGAEPALLTEPNVKPVVAGTALAPKEGAAPNEVVGAEEVEADAVLAAAAGTEVPAGAVPKEGTAIDVPKLAEAALLLLLLPKVKDVGAAAVEEAVGADVAEDGAGDVVGPKPNEGSPAAGAEEEGTPNDGAAPPVAVGAEAVGAAVGAKVGGAAAAAVVVVVVVVRAKPGAVATAGVEAAAGAVLDAAPNKGSPVPAVVEDAGAEEEEEEEAAEEEAEGAAGLLVGPARKENGVAAPAVVC